jgi:CDP-diacylglycerol--serine O-phosphatidyltransferase
MIKLLSIADVITLFNMIFGFLSLIMIFLNDMWLAFSFILIALLSDGLDGIIARKTNKSELGENLESTADMISMGIAPSLFIFNMYYDDVSWCVYYYSYLLIALTLFLSMSLIRLAAFHIMKNKKFFVGLPASASAIILLMLTYLGVEFIIIFVVIIIISVALVSNVHFPKLGIKLNAVAAFLIIFTLFMGETYNNIAPLLLLVAIVLYSIFGPIFYLITSKK